MDMWFLTSTMIEAKPAGALGIPALLDARTGGGDACQGLSCLNTGLPNPRG